ncbi:hypothetical protein [Kineosporia sp. R_H_3]|uniref:hypothetical protein n=1 Tax=Kineosporia sp. R_H_3 TaxID=1961848 RepID=UPI000B4A9DC7|nr:hypothetical protein [Kineosporia sp. R_H_3]
MMALTVVSRRAQLAASCLTVLVRRMEKLGDEAVRRSAAAARPRRSWAQPPAWTAGEPAGEVARLGPVDLEEVAEQCRRLRQDLGLPARLWTADHLGQVLLAAVRDHDRPADAAVPALLAIAADPATRSPARLSCPGPWWDTPVNTQAANADQPGGDEGETSELESLEQRLAETDGARVALQRRARDLLLGEGRPVTRLTVARRAVQLLDEPSR